VFRAGTRAERRPWRDDDDDRPDNSGGAQKLIIVLAGVAILVFGLAIGGGLGAWWMLNRPPANDPGDDDEIEVNAPPDMPPPPIGPGPMNPGPVENPPEIPDR
jgi:hypothetical protein